MAKVHPDESEREIVMCGWCFESIVKEVLEKERRDRILPEDCDEDWTAWFYLREANNFPLALERLSQSMKRKKVVPLEYLSAEVVLLRMLEILLRHGFSSPLYQRLIRQKLIRSLIVKACENGLKSAFIDSVIEPVGMPLAILYEAAAYLEEGKSKLLLKPASLLPACLDLLRHYRRGWLRDDMRADNDFRGPKEKNGVLDPIEDITDEQRERFECMLRALFFSVSMVGRFTSGTRMLHTLAKEPPAYVPGFYGNDLWLQRIAALQLYDLIGFDAFCCYFFDFRDTLFYYIFLKRGFTAKQKARLLEFSRRKPAGKRNDDFFSIE